MYLIKSGSKAGKKWVAHVWTGDDTACRLWSTGGIVAKKKYIHAANPLHISPSGEKTPLRICVMCEQNITTGRVTVPRGKVDLPDTDPDMINGLHHMDLDFEYMMSCPDEFIRQAWMDRIKDRLTKCICWKNER